MTGLCFFTELMLLKRLPHNCLLARSHYGFHSLFLLTCRGISLKRSKYLISDCLSGVIAFFEGAPLKETKVPDYFFFGLFLGASKFVFIYRWYSGKAAFQILWNTVNSGTMTNTAEVFHSHQTEGDSCMGKNCTEASFKKEGMVANSTLCGIWKIYGTFFRISHLAFTFFLSLRLWMTEELTYFFKFLVLCL